VKPALFAVEVFGFAGVGAGDLGVWEGAVLAGEVLAVVEYVDFLGAAFFLTGCFFGDEKSMDANLYMPQRIAKVIINSMFRL
jgi:hypothetical protein